MSCPMPKIRRNTLWDAQTNALRKSREQTQAYFCISAHFLYFFAMREDDTECTCLLYSVHLSLVFVHPQSSLRAQQASKAHLLMIPPKSSKQGSLIISAVSFFLSHLCMMYTLQEATGLDQQQIEALKKGFEGFDKEQSGIISGTAMQMIFKMMGVNVQVRKDGTEIRGQDLVGSLNFCFPETSRSSSLTRPSRTSGETSRESSTSATSALLRQR